MVQTYWRALIRSNEDGSIWETHWEESKEACAQGLKDQVVEWQSREFPSNLNNYPVETSEKYKAAEAAPPEDTPASEKTKEVEDLSLYHSLAKLYETALDHIAKVDKGDGVCQRMAQSALGLGRRIEWAGP